MSSRDLLQRRATNDDGDTVWVDSPLIRAARSGPMWCFGSADSEHQASMQLKFGTEVLLQMQGLGRFAGSMRVGNQALKPPISAYWHP